MAIYTDGVMKVELKRKYAYHYNIKTGSLVGTTDLDGSTEERVSFVDKLYRAGFARDEADYQAALQRVNILR